MVAFSDDVLDKTFAALAHPTRRAILTRLAQGEVASVSELAEPFDVSLMAISKHLKVMEQAGLVRREKDGRVQRCSYDPAAMGAASDWMEMHRRYWTGSLESLARWVERAAEAAGHASGSENQGSGRETDDKGESR